MTYKFLEHEADVGILGIGISWNESFQESAKAMFEVMFNIKEIKIIKEIQFEIKADSLENLFVKFLNELIAQADIQELAFSEFQVIIKNNSLICTAKGDSFDLNKYEIKTEVKAATYSGLKLYKKENKFYSQCILDV
ncbi:MAG: archease [Nanoarchaeota archaeon]|nr:archease [Nanoarchaeota archaeon]